MKHSLFKILSLCSLVAATMTTNAAEREWRKLDPNNALLLNMKHGQVVVELAPQFSPKHVAHVKKLAKDGFFDGNKFYRVVDGFVAQGGPEESKESATVNMEDRWDTGKDWQFTQVSDKDMFAEFTGFKDGFALGYSKTESKAWLAHCPGVLAMARSNDINSGSAHFYFTIGQAPRYLDGIMTIFGRVVYGMDKVQAITRTKDFAGNTIVPESAFTEILSIDVMADLPKEKQLAIEIEVTESEAFKERIAKTKNKTAEFFYRKPPPVADVCQMGIRSRLVE